MAPINHFAEILARIALVAGNAVFRAALQAYKDAASQGKLQQAFKPTLRRKMSLEEAQKILGLDTQSRPASQAETINRFNRLHEINVPSEKFIGSPYIQKKALIAKTILQEHTAFLQQDNNQK
ncbi:putative mitochondria-associated granulocyte macrophage CSF signaling molecule [Cardiosporidium cionae]|uniref:Mitochondria-associated granulocyte macrophage CSF signaling molecule n=1 Tax=Cardiosporidium cionae TaxID=476202 RepID=A0ABQ7JEG4_9APIC|nr:putative mitochondria-associated granulocyte macrophage CSF signaling molecule [Cardiosporidium cionae]|eukprot:KAF8822040.1 putative mitochondria-associated granulocyte macrophage CSF signaling molecule [Cardiosporidium cionae]